MAGTQKDADKVHRCDIEEGEVVDGGVAKRLDVEEEFVYLGEEIERETSVRILEDGGIGITQTNNQGSTDLLTIPEQLVERVVEEVSD